MKKYIAVLLLGSAIFACKPEIKPIGDYYPAGDGIIGTWILTNVKVTDITLPLPETDDVSHFYNKQDTHWTFTFNADSTYTVDEKGPGPDIFGDNGKWVFPSYPFPENIVMYGTDTVTLELKSMPRAIDALMAFSFVRSGCGEDYIDYEYELTRNQ
ncbi:MAG: DUF5004 domain-containing protein [Schleiferiaceae bacterium]|jgi:hypothetical protein|nr:DUF5004 domain-containing protein [Schleiferiaceae bacterium]